MAGGAARRGDNRTSLASTSIALSRRPVDAIAVPIICRALNTSRSSGQNQSRRARMGQQLRRYGRTGRLSRIVFALLCVSAAPAAFARPALPSFHLVPRMLVGGQTAGVSGFVPRGARCRLALHEGRVTVQSGIVRSTSGYVEYVWSVPRTVRIGSWLASLSCRGDRHVAPDDPHEGSTWRKGTNCAAHPCRFS